MMVGNSLKSDIVPAIAAGSWGVYIPHDLNWVLEHAEEPVASPALPTAGASRRAGGAASPRSGRALYNPFT